MKAVCTCQHSDDKKSNQDHLNRTCKVRPTASNLHLMIRYVDLCMSNTFMGLYNSISSELSEDRGKNPGASSFGLPETHKTSRQGLLIFLALIYIYIFICREINPSEMFYMYLNLRLSDSTFFSPDCFYLGFKEMLRKLQYVVLTTEKAVG